MRSCSARKIPHFEECAFNENWITYAGRGQFVSSLDLRVTDLEIPTETSIGTTRFRQRQAPASPRGRWFNNQILGCYSLERR